MLPVLFLTLLTTDFDLRTNLPSHICDTVNPHLYPPKHQHHHHVNNTHVLTHESKACATHVHYPQHKIHRNVGVSGLYSVQMVRLGDSNHPVQSPKRNDTELMVDLYIQDDVAKAVTKRPMWNIFTTLNTYSEQDGIPLHLWASYIYRRNAGMSYNA